jgi:hypothetical protein
LKEALTKVGMRKLRVWNEVGPLLKICPLETIF